MSLMTSCKEICPDQIQRICFVLLLFAVKPLWCMPLKLVEGQSLQNQSRDIAVNIERIRNGDYGPPDIEDVVRSKAVQAIPVLKAQFAQSADATNKGRLASALLRLGVKDDSYWNFLVEFATPAVDNDAPFPLILSPEGKLIGKPGEYSPAFIAWADAHKVPADTAAQDAVYGLPITLVIFASTGDPRGTPLLRRALKSRNYFIESMAAKGLALVKDKDSIPLLIEACKNAPTDMRVNLATALVYFDDPRAQAAADTYLPKEIAKGMREERQLAPNPFGP